MATITWAPGALAQFTPEERECAMQGGSWDRASQTCVRTQPLPAAEPLVPVMPNLGTVDPDQMFADGFIYVDGKWVRADSQEAVAYVGVPGGGGKVLAALVVPGSVLGYAVPTPAPVLLPSYVNGRTGRLELASGTRPESGGTERWIMGDVDQPRLVMG